MTLCNIISTAERKKMLSRPRLIERAISVEAHGRCYLVRGSQKMISRPKLTERTILAMAHRTCYLGQGSQKMLPWARLTESTISDAFFFFKFCSGSPTRALIKPLFLQNWCLKIVKNITCNSLTIILTIYYYIAGWEQQLPISVRRVKTSHLSSARENVPSQLGA